MQGPRALAVAGTRVALYELVVTRTYRLEFPGGSEIPPRTAVFGRGAELHILTSDTWHKVSVNDLPG